MSEASSEKIFQLFWNYDHLGGEKFDAMLLRFPGWELVAGWQSGREIKTPDKIFFEANFKSLAKTDYPVNNESWPIMSRQMLDTLLALGSFKHRIVPLIMLNKSLPPNERIDSAGNPLPGTANMDYSVLQLLDVCDCFDWEQSEYKRSRLIADRVRHISKLVVKEPPVGFPPIFRLSVKSSYLFVSDIAKEALEKAKIRGIEFWTIDRIRA